jgi:hypothetical protein
MKRLPQERSLRSVCHFQSGWRVYWCALTLASAVGCSDDDRPAPSVDPLPDETTSGATDDTHSSTLEDSLGWTRAEPTSTTMSPTVDPSSRPSDDSSDIAQTASDYPMRPLFEGLPIPIAFVGMTDTPGGVLQFAAPAQFADCPSGLALGWNQQMTTGPLWSDCAAAHITERINQAFQVLLDTDQVLFESMGYSTFEAPQYSVFTSRSQVNAALQTLDADEFTTPGQITAIISNWTHSIGGLAPYNQPLDDTNGIVLAISQVSDDAVIHEVGHALGFDHTDEDPHQTGIMTYDFCEPMSAPILSKCSCEMNLMEAVSGVCDAQCGDKNYTFDTPSHGDYFRDVATCWFTERRFAGNSIECEWPNVAHCVGYENTGMDCTCLNGVGSLQMRSCTDATTSEITELLQTCEAAFSSNDLCSSFVAYPGVYCFEREGSYDCACLSDDTPFATGKPCGEFTAEEIYATCLGEQPQTTCSTTLGDIALSCVETDEALNCICSNTGSTLDSDNTKCGDVDLNDWILSCPED